MHSTGNGELWWKRFQNLSTDYAANRREFLTRRLASILRADPSLTDEQCAERLGITEAQALHMRRTLGIRRGSATRAA